MSTENQKINQARYRERNREKVNARNLAWWRANRQKPKREKREKITGAERYAAHRDAELARCAAYRAANGERRKVISNSYYTRNKERHNAAVQRWREKNPAEAMLILARRRSKKLTATPMWANNFYMKEAYLLAVLRTKMFGFKWDVDHVVPLQSDIVCGLHWEGNFQVIPRRHNVQKSNKFWPQMPDKAPGSGKRTFNP